jgi:ligand-binding sensor domain-containing protein/signal transduction histidine kinase
MSHSTSKYRFTAKLAGYLVAASHLIAAPQEDIQFRHITANDGLSRSWVTTMCQDYLGFMWIGTFSGLNKYDGYEIIQYYHDPQDSTSVGSNYVERIFEDSRRNLWVNCTQPAPLCRYDRDRDRFVRIPLAGGASDFLEDSEGRLWVVGRGLYLYDHKGDSFEHHPTFEDTVATRFTRIAEDRNGDLWIVAGEPSGVVRYNPESGKATHYTHDPENPRSLSHNAATWIETDDSGYIWISTAGGGLNRTHVDTDGDFTHFRHDKEKPGTIATDWLLRMLIDREGNLWIGTENAGIDLLTEGAVTFHNYRKNGTNYKSLNSNSVHAITQDRLGDIWFGTYAGGVNIFNKSRQAIWHYQNIPGNPGSLSYDTVKDFTEDREGNLWVATDGGGLNLFDRQSKSFKHYDPQNSNLNDNAVLEIHQDSEGNLWIGTFTGGLSRFDRKKEEFTAYTEENSEQPSRQVYAIIEDSKGRLWVGGQKISLGKVYLGTFDWRTGSFDNSLVDSLKFSVTDLRFVEECLQGDLLFGVQEGLLRLQLDDDEFVLYTGGQGEELLSNSSVNAAIEAADYSIWVGTENGLNRIAPDGRVTRFFVRDGLPHDYIMGLCEDAFNRIWISTGGGLAQYDPHLERFMTYSLADGIQGVEFTRYSDYRAKNGTIFFGGTRGFNVIYPELVVTNEEVPRVSLTAFEIFNKPVSIGSEASPLSSHISVADEIVLSYQQAVFSFQFAALDFVAPEKNNYAYKLAGFEADWNYVGTKRSATYTSLPAGEYTFRVRGSNSDGIWNDEGTAIRVRITPPLWETAWFRLLIASLAAGVIILVYRIRVHSIEARKRQLEKQVDKRTIELREKNAELEIQKVRLEKALAELKHTRKELIEKAHKAGMADVASGVLHNIGNILNSVNTSATLLIQNVDTSKLCSLTKANELLKENIDDIEAFICNDPKGKKLLKYYLKVEELLHEEAKIQSKELERLSRGIERIKDVVGKQQQYASTEYLSEVLSLSEVLDEALSLQKDDPGNQQIRVRKDIDPSVTALVQKTKLIQVILGLMQNACESLSATGRLEREIAINIYRKDDRCYLEVSDNGIGIEQSSLRKIFNHGFSTRKGRDGFGLHSAANFVAEMKGRIRAESGGPERGAKFIVELPFADKLKVSEIAA